MINPRYMFRVAVLDANNKFIRFVFFSAMSGAPAITVREGSSFSKPEQCTGILDRNGKMIFEGDILATSNKDDSLGCDLWEPEDWGYTTVCWDSKNLCFKGDNWFVDENGSESVYEQQYVSVVGNIHETPELLNK